MAGAVGYRLFIVFLGKIDALPLVRNFRFANMFWRLLCAQGLTNRKFEPIMMAVAEKWG
jgi:hypothetical protein